MPGNETWEAANSKVFFGGLCVEFFALRSGHVRQVADDHEFLALAFHHEGAVARRVARRLTRP